MSEMNDEPQVQVEEKYFLRKFHGDSTEPEDEFERIEFDSDFQIVAVHKIENGEIITTEAGGDYNSSN